jgi:lactoylglutathione lyase
MSGASVADHQDDEHIGYAHIAISVGSRDGLDQLTWKMEKEGVLVAAPRLTRHGFYEAVIKDPDGNVIEVTT